MIRTALLAILLAAPAAAQVRPPEAPVDACAATALPDLRRAGQFLRAPPRERTAQELAREQARLQRSPDLAAMLSCLMHGADGRRVLGRAG